MKKKKEKAYKWKGSTSSGLLGFSYYKSAVRNECLTCGLILCRPEHLGSTRLARDPLDCLNATGSSLAVTHVEGETHTRSFVAAHCFMSGPMKTEGRHKSQSGVGYAPSCALE